MSSIKPDKCSLFIHDAKQVINSNLKIFVLLVLQLLAMIFSCCLWKAAGKEDNYA